MSDHAHRIASGGVAAGVAFAIGGIPNGQAAIFLSIGLVLGVAFIWYPSVFGSFPGFQWSAIGGPSPEGIVRGMGWAFLLALLCLAWIANVSSRPYAGAF